MKNICVGFCIRKPCNCEDVINHLQEYRQEKLKCAESREFGGKCICPETTCNKSVEYWIKQIESQSFENWYVQNEKQKLRLSQKLKDLKKKALKELSLTKWRWVMISCKPDMQPAKLAELAESVVKNKPFRKYAYCLEFTGEKQQYHPHVHLLYEINDSKPSADIKQFMRKFDTINNCVNIDEIMENQLKEKLCYIKGEKQESKLWQVKLDKEIREKNNIKDFYYNEEFLSNYILDNAS